MLRIFLVEDESIIRETLRDTVPWTRCGYTFVGEAGDGEMALPLIRKTRPDVLVTDIRMPFMDGLALSKQVLREFPDMKIIILSGYDDFEYAQQAIRLGVERYLLKPITKASFTGVLQEVREKIESERETRSYSAQHYADRQEYEQYARRAFMERLVGGSIREDQISEQAALLDIDLTAESYCLAMFSVLPEQQEQALSAAQVRDTLLRNFLKHPEYLPLRWGANLYLLLIKSQREAIAQWTDLCIQMVLSTCQAVPNLKWYLAVGSPAQTLAALHQCYDELSRLWACRYILPNRHLLTADTVVDYLYPSSNQGLRQLDAMKCNPSILMDVLKSASREEIPSFADTFLGGVQEGLRSAAFCNYLMLSIRFTAAEFVTTVLEQPQEALLSQVEHLELLDKPMHPEELHNYLVQILEKTIALRDRSDPCQGSSQLRQAIDYIDQHYAEETLSLNRVAQTVGISPNYLSGVFSQEMGDTFVEYVTKKRMSRARELLRTTELRSGEIAAMVGYRDSHYFSFLFRKTQGCTPRDYRSGGK